MRRPNSRGSFRPLLPATWAMSSTMSWICDSSTAAPVATSAVAPPKRFSNFSMSWANASSSTFPTVAPMEIKARAMPFASFVASAVFRSSMATDMAGGRRPTMPKSRKPTRPSSTTKRFPAWTSAWKNSHRCTESAQTFRAATSVASGSAEYCLMPSKSTRGTPRSRSMVNTLREDAPGNGRGATAAPSRPFSTRKSRNVSKFCCSCRKSNSPSIDVRKSDAMSAKEPRLLSSGLMNSKIRDARYTKPRSVCNTSSIPGFCTFTTTSSPVRRVAAWTCAIDADAMGMGSKYEKTLPVGMPKSSSMIFLISEKGTVLVESRHCWNSRT
mmetsp:Transcript_24326/g.66336  ORF Transcript_24326/g.66336 Transcript_24326/m.66336 type:complete len:327 (+) Transcript_24326:127-1107(+)